VEIFLNHNTSNSCNNISTLPDKTGQIMTKRSRLPWLIIGGIILLVIIIAALFLFSPSPQQVTLPATTGISATDFVAPTAPQPPSCTVAISSQKVPPSSVRLQVMANTCITGDITALRVSVNGAQKGMLDASPGTGATFTGTSGTNTVSVVARFSNGAESVVYQGLV
jgi:hypothetical protein